MSSRIPSAPLRQLQSAFRDGRLNLFLGAGCSVASGIPMWNQLVTSLYMNGVSRRLHQYRRVNELLPSVTQWAFERYAVPLELAARGLNTYYREDDGFVRMIQTMLYNGAGSCTCDHARSARCLQKIRPLRVSRNSVVTLFWADGEYSRS